MSRNHPRFTALLPSVRAPVPSFSLPSLRFTSEPHGEMARLALLTPPPHGEDGLSRRSPFNDRALQPPSSPPFFPPSSPHFPLPLIRQLSSCLSITMRAGDRLGEDRGRAGDAARAAEPEPTPPAGRGFGAACAPRVLDHTALQSPPKCHFLTLMIIKFNQRNSLHQTQSRQDTPHSLPPD